MSTPGRPSIRPTPASVPVEHPDYNRERYRVGGAAEYLGVSTALVYRAIATGTLSHRKVSARLYLFSQADLDLYRAAQRVEAADARSQKVRGAKVVGRPQLILPKKRVFGAVER